MRDAQVMITDTSVDIDMGEMSIMFSAPTELGTDTIEVLLYGNGQTITGTVSSKSIVGALKALQVGHEKRKAHEKGREGWQTSMQQQQAH